MSVAAYIELVGGGPADGVSREFPEGLPVIRIYTPRQDVGAFFNAEEADGKSQLHQHETHIYRRENRLTSSGRRVYTYAGKERA